MYQVLALIPPASDFSLDKATEYFRSLRFRDNCVRVESAQAEAQEIPTGFRVWYEDWSIVAWIDDAPGVLVDSQHMVDRGPLSGRPEVVASCARRLSVWSDEDPDFDHSDEMTHFTDRLRERFGMFIYDPVNGEWWA